MASRKLKNSGKKEKGEEMSVEHLEGQDGVLLSGQNGVCYYHGERRTLGKGFVMQWTSTDLT